ncbi:MAG: hypothetical protein LBV33_07270 [Lachnospiraceae bacterium]|nr:hypothetical protein [Lachnospiraceae bacterium]
MVIKMIQRVIHDNKELAIIIRKDFHEEGIHFLTDDNYSQQLAYMCHPVDKSIDAHVHNYEERIVIHTQETLIIRKGVLRVDFYLDDHSYFESWVLHAGDIILLVSGGHGFVVLEDVEMVEVKQGPYGGPNDKTRFDAINSSQIIIRGES